MQRGCNASPQASGHDDGPALAITRVRSSRRLLAASYDRAASDFADAADQHVYRLLARPLVEALEGSIEHDGWILDVAAGTGAVGRQLGQVVATDLSIGQLRHNTAEIRVAVDGERLAFRDDAFTAAACGFGINHVARPDVLVHEMARVASVVGLSTWERPEVPYGPKRLVFEALARRGGRSRSRTGDLVDRLTDAVGSADVIDALLRSADLATEVEVVEVDIPWPGVDPYLRYRVSMPTSAEVAIDDDLRGEVRAAIDALSPEELIWRPRVIVGVGVRT